MNRILIFAMVAASLAYPQCKPNTKETEKMEKDVSHPSLKLSLAQWSFHRALFAGEMDHFQFIDKAAELGFEGVEYVALFFKDHAEDTTFLHKMNERAASAGIRQLLIMIDGEGDLGDSDPVNRNAAVENHKKWIRAGKYLGCHSIRVNAFGSGTKEDQMENIATSLKALGEYAAQYHINVLVENHGGYSSDGKWLSEVMKKVNLPNVGTLPDFGNFCLERENGERWGTPCVREYDRYLGIEELMPYAKAVSAKSYHFNDDGGETIIDYRRMIDIVKNSGYQGFIGVEYEGSQIPAEDGVKLTKSLIEKYL